MFVAPDGIIGALGPPPAGVDAAVFNNERAESIYHMLQDLSRVISPQCLFNGARIRWLGPKNVPTMNTTGCIQYLVSVEFSIPAEMADGPTFTAAAADFAESKMANGNTIFGAGPDLMKTIRALDHQYNGIPRNVLDAHGPSSWPWSHNFAYLPPPTIAMRSLGITAALCDSLPIGCSLVEPAFMDVRNNSHQPCGFVMVSALFQCQPRHYPDPERDIVPAVFKALLACTGGCGVENAAHANVFTHANKRQNVDGASTISSTLWRGCRNGARLIFGDHSELVNLHFDEEDAEEEDEDEGVEG